MKSAALYKVRVWSTLGYGIVTSMIRCGHATLERVLIRSYRLIEHSKLVKKAAIYLLEYLRYLTITKYSSHAYGKYH